MKGDYLQGVDFMSLSIKLTETVTKFRVVFEAASKSLQ
jgi:hypothetical protein